MTALDLRPLSLGEILDRTFTLYRRNFLLFVGISGIPQILVLALRLGQTLFLPRYNSLSATLWLSLLIFVAAGVAYLLSQGGAVLAVSKLYLGRSTTIGESLRRVWGEFGSIFGVVLLNGIVVCLGLICLIIPGIYLACRLLVCVPAAMIEDRGAIESLQRSFGLTRDNAGRSFVILLLSLVLSYAGALLLGAPFSVMVVVARNDPEMVRIWLALAQMGSSIASMLIGPILLIATSIYYYDLRVRKEAFDLQIMMDPTSQGGPRVGGPISLTS